MYYDIYIQYKGKEYRRQVLEIMRGGYFMESKGKKYYFNPTKNGWELDSIGDRLPQEMVDLIGIELSKIEKPSAEQKRRENRDKKV